MIKISIGCVGMFLMFVLLLTGALNIFIAVSFATVFSMAVFLSALLASLVLSLFQIEEAARVHSRRDSVFAVLSVAMSSILLFALVYWGTYRMFPKQFGYNSVVIDERGADAVESVRSELRRDNALVICLLALQSYPAAQAPEVGEGEFALQLSDAVFMSREQELHFTPEGSASTERVMFSYEGERISLERNTRANPIAFAFNAVSTNKRNRYEVELSRADSLSELKETAGKYIDFLNDYRERSLNELHTHLWEQADLNIWDFVYCSVAAFTTLGTGDIVPAKTFARLVVGAEAIVALIIAGYGVDLFLKSLKGKGAEEPTNAE